MKVLFAISSMLNTRDYQYNINNLTKRLIEKQIIDKIPIDINELRKLINYQFAINL